MNRYVLIVEGPGYVDYEEIELPAPPEAGDPIQTKIGTCVVTGYEDDPDRPPTVGRIVCRLPS